jgi:hypothetical protein
VRFAQSVAVEHVAEVPTHLTVLDDHHDSIPTHRLFVSERQVLGPMRIQVDEDRLPKQLVVRRRDQLGADANRRV